MTEGSSSGTRPYKFLDYFELGDVGIFFGRNLEIELLLSDIISERLVLLFARTGSGKTSLINAGVRPRLEKLDYKTFYIRVEKDPTESARVILRNEDLLEDEWESLTLDVQLEKIVQRLNQPVVLFFDQFEEFFIYIVDEKSRMDFITAIARLYRNRDSGVHVVFSFREEFFVEMEAFRTEIPSIFHNESNLRLRWFNKDQAREAIVKPAARFGTEIESSLVETLIDDLAEERGIEPARLQVVCDTLWREKTGDIITLFDYERLGRADRIVERRLEEDIDEHLDDEQLSLFEKLLPALRTRVGIKTEQPAMRGRVFEQMLKPFKYGRTIVDLVSTLRVDKDVLIKLVERLKRLHLVKEVKRFDDIYIEWTSDYLADLTDFLLNRVRALLLGRLVVTAMNVADQKKRDLKEQGRMKDGQWPGSLTDTDLAALYMSPATFKEISEGASFLDDLSQSKAAFLFEASLQHGDQMTLWYRKAKSLGYEEAAWQIIDEKIEGNNARFEQSENAVKLLGRINEAKALDYFKKALKQDILAPCVIPVLSEMKTEEAMKMLAEAMEQDKLADLVIDSLVPMRTTAAIDLLASALKKESLTAQAEAALERVSRVKNHPSSYLAIRILSEWRQSLQVGKVILSEKQDRVSVSPGLMERDWNLLLHRIRDGRCIPVFGPEASSEQLPSLADIARKWVREYRYPLEDDSDIALVAEYLAVEYDSIFPKDLLSKEYQNIIVPASDQSDSFTLLAELPLPVYITTTYDDLIYQALLRKGKSPRWEICRWNRYTRDSSSVFDDSSFEPTVSKPVVFHLFGHVRKPESLVLTATDIFDFLVNISRNPLILPPQIQHAITRSANLFLGLSFPGLIFQVTSVLFTSFFEKALVRGNFAVLNMDSIEVKPEQQPGAREYLDRYFASKEVRTYWGTVREFSAELRERWEQFSNTDKA